MHFVELNTFAKTLKNRISILNKKKDIQKRMFTIATRAAHDIQTPLSVLGILSEEIENKIPQNEKLVFEKSITKIKSIAQDLFEFRKVSAEKSKPSDKCTLEYISIEFYTTFKEKMPKLSINLSRNIRFAISNTFTQTHTNKLTKITAMITKNIDDNIETRLKLYYLNNQSLLKISLQSKSNSFKHGVNNIKKLVDQSELKANIMLSPDKKEISIHCPISIDTPTWQLDRIHISKFKHIIIFDVESLYHNIWEQTFQAHPMLTASISVTHCYKEQEFLAAITTINNETLIQIDYDLKGNPFLGIDYIKQLDPNKYSILVTNHFNDARVQNVL